MLEAISRNAPKKFDQKEIQLYRLCGLLHDIGHYPFSHTFEHVIKNHYSQSQFFGDGAAVDSKDPPAFDHELLGRKLIETDLDLNSILKSHNLNADEVKAAFSLESPESLSPIISSDLDCDRLDYLMRTAHHAGLPYGKVDVPYIVSQMTLDQEGKPCVTRKAIRAADHFLISRYFDYTQLPFHKTVVALELALETAITGVISRKKLDCSASGMRSMISRGDWNTFDDQKIIELFRRELSDPETDKDPLYKFSLRAVLNRQPPKAVLIADRIGERGQENSHKGNLNRLRSAISKWAKKANVQEELWQIWDVKLGLTKMGATAPAVKLKFSEATNDEEARSQLIWVKGLDPLKPDSSAPITLAKDTLVHTLSDKQFFGLRVYVSLEDKSKCEEIRRFVVDEMADLVQPD